MSDVMKEARYRPNVGACIFNSQGKLFVAERVDILGAWQPVQGGIDQGESPQTAVYREIEEEVGLLRDHLQLIDVIEPWLYYDFPSEKKYFEGKYKGQKQKWFAFRLVVDERYINLNNTIPPEFSHYRWIELEDLPFYAVDFKKEVFRQLCENFQHLVK